MLSILTAQACALPINIGFAFLRGDEKPVTTGCKTKTCCTALCYVDKHGVHHCVHETDESSACGILKNEVKKNPVLPLPTADLPEPAPGIPELLPTAWIAVATAPIESTDISVPSPPPK
jgi:hypothetical protein